MDATWMRLGVSRQAEAVHRHQFDLPNIDSHFLSLLQIPLPLGRGSMELEDARETGRF